MIVVKDFFNFFKRPLKGTNWKKWSICCAYIKTWMLQESHMTWKDSWGLSGFKTAAGRWTGLHLKPVSTLKMPGCLVTCWILHPCYWHARDLWLFALRRDGTPPTPHYRGTARNVHSERVWPSGFYLCGCDIGPRRSRLCRVPNPVGHVGLMTLMHFAESEPVDGSMRLLESI